MRRRPRLAAGALALIALLAGAGCRPPRQGRPARPEAAPGPGHQGIMWGAPKPISERVTAPQYTLPEGWKAAVTGVMRIRVSNSGALRNDPATVANARRFQELTGILVELLPWAEPVVAAKTIAVLSAHSDAVDVLCYDHAVSYLRLLGGNWIEPVDALWNDPNVWKHYPQSLQKGLTAPDGSIYGSVGRVSTQMLYYRPSVVPSPPKTWREVREAAKRAPGMWGYVFGAGSGDLIVAFAAMVYSQGGRLVDTAYQRLVVSSPEGQRAWRLLTDMVLADRSAPGRVVDYSQMEAADAFALGRAAMVLGPTTETDRFRSPQTAPGISNDWAAVPAPKWDSEQPDSSMASALGLEGYAVNRFIDDKQKAAAMLFLDFMRSREAGTREFVDEGNEAVVLDIHDAPGAGQLPFAQARRAAVVNSVLEPLPPAGREVTDLVAEYFARAARGAVEPAQALEELQSLLDDYAVPR